MTCSDFCTADKCAELEAKITSLESSLELLRLSFESHILRPIPIAHNYEPLVVVDVVLNHNEETTENELRVDVSIDNIPAFGSAILPSTSIDFLDLKILDSGQNNFLFELYINDLIASTELEIPEPQINLDVFELEPDNLGLSMTVGTQQAQTKFTITHPEPTENNQHVKSDLRGSASYKNGYLTISIADGESQDIFSTLIPTNQSPQTVFVTEEVFMNCDELEELIRNKFDILDQDIENITTKVDIVETIVNTNIDDSLDAQFTCVSPEENTEDSEATEPTITTALVNYNNQPFLALNDAIKILNSNLLAIYTQTCLLDFEVGDVITLVASDKYLTKISGKVLILHFVTLDNYPKRQKNSSYKPTQIPAPKPEFNWEEDFKDLRKIQGNQYAKLSFVEPFVPVSGWFKNEAAANAFFDWVMTVTTATEDNRVISIHNNPKTNIIEQELRPYRAFISSVGSDGKGICEAKYVPTNDNNDP